MRKSVKFSPEVRERAVRMVFEHRGGYKSQWAAVVSVAGKIGSTSQTLLNWVRQHERDTGQREGPSTTETQRVKELEREVRELRKANEILKLASAFFAQAELDRGLSEFLCSRRLVDLLSIDFSSVFRPLPGRRRRPG